MEISEIEFRTSKHGHTRLDVGSIFECDHSRIIRQDCRIDKKREHKIQKWLTKILATKADPTTVPWIMVSCSTFSYSDPIVVFIRI